MTNYAIIANGPFLSKNIIQETISNKKIIALDGAINKLQDYNITPDIILGDFDSVDTFWQEYWGIKKINHKNENIYASYQGRNGVVIVRTPDQEATDLVKAIRYCDANQASSIVVVCATGGREDHHEGMKIALRTEYRKNRNLIVHSCYQSLCYAVDETVVIHGKPLDYCGVVAFARGSCISKGLEYELNGHDISICNRLISFSAILDISGEALIIMPPQLSGQREFIND